MFGAAFSPRGSRLQQRSTGWITCFSQGILWLNEVPSHQKTLTKTLFPSFPSLGARSPRRGLWSRALAISRGELSYEIISGDGLSRRARRYLYNKGVARQFLWKIGRKRFADHSSAVEVVLWPARAHSLSSFLTWR